MNTPALKLNTTPLRQVQDVRGLLMNQQARDQLGAVAAKHMNPERMMRVVANAIRTTPKLQQCEPMSFLGALMQCAALGLEPNTILGHAYMIPFENKRKGVVEVQVIVGYKGLIDLARRSGHITSIAANIHYSDDDLWEYEEGTESRLRHRPGMLRGEKLHAYAIAKFKDGGHAYVVLPWTHVMSIRDGSQGYQTAKRFGKTAETPWVKYEDEMAKKTAIRALSKYLPLSVDFMDAMQVDEASADYRAFALDPTAGVQTDPDETIDGETGEILDARAEIEDTRATQQPAADMAPQRREAPPAKRSARDDTPYAEMGASKTAKAAAAPEPGSAAGADAEQFEGLLDLMLAELGQSGPDETEHVYAAQIEQMRASAPDCYRRWHEALTQARGGAA